MSTCSTGIFNKSKGSKPINKPGPGIYSTHIMHDNLFFCNYTINCLVLCTHAVVVETQEMVTGYTDDGVVVLTCEVYGYLRSDSLTVRWSRETGSARQLLQNTPKYTIEYSSGSRLAQNPDGTTRQSIVANLTIHQLEPADTGRYVCEADGDEEAATQVTVMPSSRSTGQTSVTRVTEVTTDGSTG